MSDAQARVRKCRERVPRSAGDDAGQMRLALVLGRDLRQRSGIGNAQGVGEAQQATTCNSVQGPRRAPLIQPSPIGSIIGKLRIWRDFRQPVQRSSGVVQQVAQSWISFTDRDAGGDRRRLSIGLRLLLYLRICALFARHARCIAAADAVSGASSNLRVGAAVHASFISRRGAAVKPLKKNPQVSPMLYKKSSTPPKAAAQPIPGAIATV